MVFPDKMSVVGILSVVGKLIYFYLVHLSLLSFGIKSFFCNSLLLLAWLSLVTMGCAPFLFKMTSRKAVLDILVFPYLIWIYYNPTFYYCLSIIIAILTIYDTSPAISKGGFLFKMLLT